jgi:hypothetical protein
MIEIIFKQTKLALFNLIFFSIENTGYSVAAGITKKAS